MNLAYRILAVGLLPVMAPSVMANTAATDEPQHRQVEAMSFAQCADLIHSYEDQFGPAHVVLDAPTLRVVQFANQGQTEQLTCDGDDNLITFFEMKAD